MKQEQKTLYGTMRKQKIIEELHRTGNVSVNDLAERYGVSQMTIRRDLAFLENQGVLITNYGGAHLPSEHREYPDYSQRKEQRISVKRAIGKRAASFIEEGDTIFLDAGSTTLQVAKCFPDVHATVITNSISIIQYLCSNGKVKLIVAPGIYRNDVGGMLGNDTISFLKQYYVKKSFFAGAACAVETGALTSDETDAQMKRAVWENSQKSFLLADHEKFYQYANVIIKPLEDFSYILSDKALDIKVQEAVKRKNPELLLC